MGLFYCKGLINMTKPKAPEDLLKRGCKPFFENPEEMQTLIDDYFELCNGVKALDEDGNPMATNKGWLYKVDPKPPTISGLAFYLGFADKGTLRDYAVKPDFSHTISRARLWIETYVEGRLFDRDGAKGAEFNLVSNFDWKPISQIQITNNTLNLSMSDEEKDLRMQKIVKRLSESGQLGLLAEKLEAEQK